MPRGVRRADAVKEIGAYGCALLAPSICGAIEPDSCKARGESFMEPCT